MQKCASVYRNMADNTKLLTTLECCVCVIVCVKLIYHQSHVTNDPIAFDKHLTEKQRQHHINFIIIITRERNVWNSCLFIISIITIGRVVEFSQRYQPMQLRLYTYSTIHIAFVLNSSPFFTLLFRRTKIDFEWFLWLFLVSFRLDCVLYCKCVSSSYATYKVSKSLFRIETFNHWHPNNPRGYFESIWWSVVMRIAYFVSVLKITTTNNSQLVAVVTIAEAQTKCHCRCHWMHTAHIDVTKHSKRFAMGLMSYSVEIKPSLLMCSSYCFCSIIFNKISVSSLSLLRLRYWERKKPLNVGICMLLQAVNDLSEWILHSLYFLQHKIQLEWVWVVIVYFVQFMNCAHGTQKIHVTAMSRRKRKKQGKSGEVYSLNHFTVHMIARNLLNNTYAVI